MPKTQIAFEPLSSIFGVKVSGVDLREIDEATAISLREAWHKHALLLFRGQDLSEEQIDRVSSIFGEISYEGVGRRKYVSNVMEDQLTPNGELAFHTDLSFTDNPLRGLLLYAFEVPPPGKGGETLFASAQRAYGLLPEDLRRRIERLRITHRTFEERQKTYKYSSRSTHPIAYVHPVTGDKLLFISPHHVDRIEGVPDSESKALCETLAAYITRNDNVYAHSWRPGDLAVWDNLKLQHARTDFDPSYRRHLRRTQLQAPT